MPVWYVYILECRDGRLYTGVTLDIKRRLREHSQGKGGRFTKSFGVKKLVYSEKCSTRSDALKREARIKKLSRKNKLALIKENNPANR